MPIYSFITDKDLDVGMKKYFRDQIIGANAHILNISEGAAFSIIKTKLGGRYDLAKLFPSIKAWDNAAAYITDQYAYKGDKIYIALQNGTNQDPATATTYWKELDPRDQLLVVFCVNITIYFLVESICPHKLSDDITNAFTQAMEWLESCQNGNENPDWPLLEAGSSTINWGSNEKLDHYY